MNTQSNGYTVVYSAIMVVVVAAALTLIAVGLKDRQQTNIDNEKRQNILKSAGIAVDGSVEESYNKFMKDAYVISPDGKKIEDDDNKSFNTDLSDNTLPVFEIDNNGEKLYVVPLKGNGLWGAIWGFASLKSDFNTISGVVFDHASDTPGLCAEMTQEYFCNQFKGRQLFEAQDFVGISKV
ncbi:MAG: Na(+)-translocating NADH-quinone reductase subunit C, partial [Bacteroidales bacterium]|nr:Na(+)-translocating NADH-quinone reductase subunit C [Bacteroidales bacterium]